MLILNSSGTTKVTVTLYEKSSNITNPYFTWNIFRKGSNDSITFCSDDLSYAPYYWNQFNITVATSSIGLTSGIIPLTEGEWIYNIWEMQTQYDLNINNAIGLVENGLMVVGLTYSTVVSPIATNAIRSIPVFRP